MVAFESFDTRLSYCWTDVLTACWANAESVFLLPKTASPGKHGLRLDHGFHSENLRPVVMGEFADLALLTRSPLLALRLFTCTNLFTSTNVEHAALEPSRARKVCSQPGNAIQGPATSSLIPAIVIM